MILTVMPGGGGGAHAGGLAGSMRTAAGKQPNSMPPVHHALQSALPPQARQLPPGAGPLDKNGRKMTNEMVKQRQEARHLSGPMKADHSIRLDRESRSSTRRDQSQQPPRLEDGGRNKSSGRHLVVSERRSPSEPRSSGVHSSNTVALNDRTSYRNDLAQRSKIVSEVRTATDAERRSSAAGSHDSLSKAGGGSSSRNGDGVISGSSRPSLSDQRYGAASYGTDHRTVDSRRRSQSLQRPAPVHTATADVTRPVAMLLSEMQPPSGHASKTLTRQPMPAATVGGGVVAVGGAASSPKERGGFSSKSSPSPSESSASAASLDDGYSGGGGGGSSRGQPSSGRSPAVTSGSESTASLEDSGKVGLQNLGNTCFMNSVLQCMSNTRPLLHYVLYEFTDEHINRKTSTMKGGLIRAFAKLIDTMWRKDSKQPVAPKDFKSQIQSFAPRFVGYSQQDAQEFLHYLLQGLHEDINRVQQKVRLPPMDEVEEAKYQKDAEIAIAYWKRYRMIDDSKIVDIFVGQLRSTLTCQSCRYASVTFDPFWDLSVPIPSRAKSHSVSISDCLRAFIEEETLDGDEKPTCSSCKRRTVCTKRFTVQHFPKVLILHLKRFSGERFRSKLSSPVDFPLDGLDLLPYAAPGIRPKRYRLYGVVNHSGSVNSGHYTAFCRHPVRESSWFEFNDSRVSPISAASLVTAEAYVLFYEACAT